MDFRLVLSALVDADVDFVVVGGVGAILQGVPVTTFDLDVVHARDETNRKRLLGVLEALEACHREHLPKVLRPTEADLASDGHMLLMTVAGPLDLLGRVGGGLAHEDLVERSHVLDIGGGRSVRVLDLEALVERKERTGREKDRAQLPLPRRTLGERKKRWAAGARARPAGVPSRRLLGSARPVRSSRAPDWMPDRSERPPRAWRAGAVLAGALALSVGAALWHLERGPGRRAVPVAGSADAAPRGAAPEAPVLPEDELQGSAPGDGSRTALDPAAASSPAPGTLDLRLVSAVHGGPLEGVVVWLDAEDLPELEGRSDGAGRLEMELASGVAWELLVEEDDEHEWVQLDLEPLAPGERRELELALATAGDVPWFGRVTRGGEPFAGVRVRMLEGGWDGEEPLTLAEETSDAGGLVRFDGSSWRSLEARADVPGVGLRLARLQPGHETPDTAQPMPLWPVGAVRCEVVDARDAPLGSLEVSASTRTWNLQSPESWIHTRSIRVAGRTDEDGLVLLADVPADVPIGFQVRSGEQLLLDEEPELLVAAGETAERRFVVGEPGRVEGLVLSSAGDPLGGLSVELFPADDRHAALRVHGDDEGLPPPHTATSDSGGRFAFDAVPYGPWYVSATPAEPGSYALAPRVELGPGQPHAEVTLRLERGTRIAGRVVDAEGEGVAGAELSGWADGLGGIGRPESDADGSFAFEAVPPGLFHVWARARGFLDRSVSEVAAGTTDVLIVLERALVLRGTVLDALTGLPVAEGLVHAWARDGEDFTRYCQTAPVRAGRFELDRLPAGEIALCAISEAGGVGILRGIHVAGGRVPPEVVVPVRPGIPVRARYDGPVVEDLGLQGVQQGVVVAWLGARQGESLSFLALPGELQVRAMAGARLVTRRTLQLGPDDRPDVALGGD